MVVRRKFILAADAGMSGRGEFTPHGGAQVSCAAYGEQTSVDAGGGAVSDFN